MTYRKVCTVCGKEFDATGPAARKCPDCKVSPNKRIDVKKRTQKAMDKSSRMAEAGFNYGDYQKQRILDEIREKEGKRKPVEQPATVEESAPASTPINPTHYNRFRIEPWDAIDEWGLDFDRGSAVKYIVRAGHKDDYIQDIKKAVTFLNHHIECMERKNNV